MNILNNVSMDLRYPKRLSFYPDQKKAGFYNYAQKFEGFNLSDDLLKKTRVQNWQFVLFLHGGIRNNCIIF